MVVPWYIMVQSKHNMINMAMVHYGEVWHWCNIMIVHGILW